MIMTSESDDPTGCDAGGTNDDGWGRRVGSVSVKNICGGIRRIA